MRAALFALLPASLALASCDMRADGNIAVGSNARTSVTINDPVVRLPAVPGRPGVAYFRVTTEEPDELLALSAPGVRVELHETRVADGVASMERVANLVIPAGGTLEFKPGGKHAMLFGLDPALKPGGEVPLTFTFRTAPAMTVQADVQAVGGGGDAHTTMVTSHSSETVVRR